jgi:hypothetical protein
LAFKIYEDFGKHSPNTHEQQQKRISNEKGLIEASIIPIALETALDFNPSIISRLVFGTIRNLATNDRGCAREMKGIAFCAMDCFSFTSYTST